MREARLSIGPARTQRTNPWAGWPPATHLAPYITLQVVVEGEPDPASGYLCDIHDIDGVLFDYVQPRLFAETQRGPCAGEHLLSNTWGIVSHRLPPGVRLQELHLAITPYLIYHHYAGAVGMISITQSFEFAAAHRLYCSDYTPEQNLQAFGKCSNPNGHGHNYILEVTLRGEPDRTTGLVYALPKFEQLVHDLVIDSLDHKHLNLDCPEFTRLNPSVENITRVIWDKLQGKFHPAVLAQVRVWETPKTYAQLNA